MFDFDKNGNIIEVDDEPKETVIEEEQSKRLDVNIWTVVKNILQSKDKLPWKDIEKVYNKFLIHRALVGNKNFIEFIAILNRFSGNISNQIHYELLHSIIPKRKGAFYPYLKTKEFDSDIIEIGKFYKKSPYKISKIWKVLNEETKKKILEKIKIETEKLIYSNK